MINRISLTVLAIGSLLFLIGMTSEPIAVMREPSMMELVACIYMIVGFLGWAGSQLHESK